MIREPAMPSPSVVTVEPHRSKDVLQALESAGAGQRVEALVGPARGPGLDPFEKHFPVSHRLTVPGVGRCTIYGRELPAAFKGGRESLADVLYRRGFDGTVASDLEREAAEGRVLLFIDPNVLDVSGLAMTFEREPGLHVVKPKGGPRTLAADGDAGTRIRERSRRVGRGTFFSDES